MHRRFYYVTAGHKGNPEEVKKGEKEGVIASRGGRGTLEKEKPPIFGMIQRGGEVVIRMLENVKQRTIEPLIKATITAGTMVYTDEYAIYNPLQDWGYAHKTVCHGAGEYARDEDGDGSPSLPSLLVASSGSASIDAFSSLVPSFAWSSSTSASGRTRATHVSSWSARGRDTNGSHSNRQIC